MKSRRRGLRRRGPSGRGGFILMEVVVAITLLALIMTPLAGMVLAITANSHRTVGNTYRNGVLMREVNLYEAIQYDSLVVGTFSTVRATKPYPHTSTVTIVEVLNRNQLKAKTVKLVIVPANPLYRRDSVTFLRSTAATTTAFMEDLQ